VLAFNFITGAGNGLQRDIPSQLPDGGKWRTNRLIPVHPTGMSKSDANRTPRINLEILGNLIYLAKHTDSDTAKRHEYLDRAARVVSEIGAPQSSK
jgi:hypothetical protein